MKFLLIAGLSVGLLFSQAYAQEKSKLESHKDKISYSVGFSIGNNIKNQPIEVDPDIVVKGIKDALAGSQPLMSEKEIQEAITELRQELVEKQKERMEELAEKNKKAGEAFLGENKKKEGVVTLPSGLQYKIIAPGTGESPKAIDSVTTHYRGTLIDGTEFDSSYKRGKPVTFKVNGVIAGWTEALQLMKVGAKWQLFIPSDLAYGNRGAGPHIGPNQTLLFEVELLAINGPEEEKGHAEGKENDK